METNSALPEFGLGQSIEALFQQTNLGLQIPCRSDSQQSVRRLYSCVSHNNFVDCAGLSGIAPVIFNVENFRDGKMQVTTGLT